MTALEEFILEEYRQAQHLTYDVDDKRVSLTKYFFAVIGILLAAILAIGKGEAQNIPFRIDLLMPLLAFLVWVLSLVIILILARLRKVQLEHFRIILRIRKYFLKKDYSLWNVLQLSERTLPNRPSSSSGTYFWTLLIIIIGSFALPMSLAFTTVVNKSSEDLAYVLLYCTSFVIFHFTYMNMAVPKEEEVYSEKNEPFVARDTIE